VQVLPHAIGTEPRAMAEHAPFDVAYDDRALHSGFGGGVHHCLGHVVARPP